MGKTIIFLILLIFSPINLFASYHCSDCPDEDFINLGRNYPSVGYFSSKIGILGSGTLVELGSEKLQGRVVISCAHIFEDLDGNETTFSIEGYPSVRGTPFPHPKYLELIKESEKEDKLLSPDSYDISLFILDAPILNLSLAQVDLDTPTESLLDSLYVSVGYGLTGHFFGKYLINDSNKRASYAYASPSENEQSDKEVELTICEEGEGGTSIIRKQTITQLKGSTLTLTPYMTGRVLSRFGGSHETFKKPAGIARNGDSGGGSFNVQGKLIGVISGGAGRDLPVEEETLVFKKSYFLSYEEFIKQNLEPCMLKCIESNEISAYMHPNYNLESFEEDKMWIADLRLTSLSYHKQWIEQFLLDIQK